MRHTPVILLLALVIVSPLDAFAGKKKKDKKKKKEEAAQVEAAPAPVAEEAPTGLVIPDWVGRITDDGKPVVVLLDAGAEPRQELRMGAKAGQKGTILMDMKMDMKMAMGEMVLPSMDMPVIGYVMDLEVTDRSPEGELSLHTMVRDIMLKGGDPMLVDAMAASLESMKGLQGTSVMDTRGFVREMSFDVPEGAPAEVAQQIQSMESQSGNLAVPLPAEAVGVGAKWEILQTQESQGMRFAQRSVVTLTERKGSVVRLDTTIEQALRDESPDMPNLPPGSSVSFQQFSSSGGGYNVQDLEGLVPTEGKARMDMSMDMEVDVGGTQQPFSMVISIDVELAKPTE